MENLLDKVYSQDIVVDQKLKKAFYLQISEFFKNFKYLDEIIDFLVERHLKYRKFLSLQEFSSYKPVKKILTTIGLTNLLPYKYSNNIPIDELTSKRGTKQLFLKILKNANMYIDLEQVYLVKLDPIKLLTEKSKKEVSASYLENIQDFQSIREVDLPQPIPAIKPVVITDLSYFYHYEPIFKALLFESNNILDVFVSKSIKLKDLFIFYFLLKNVIEYEKNRPQLVNNRVINDNFIMSASYYQLYEFALKKTYPELEIYNADVRSTVINYLLNKYLGRNQSISVTTGYPSVDIQINNDIYKNRFFVKLNITLIKYFDHFRVSNYYSTVFTNEEISKKMGEFYKIFYDTFAWYRENDFEKYIRILLFLKSVDKVTLQSYYKTLYIYLKKIIDSYFDVEKDLKYPSIPLEYIDKIASAFFDDIDSYVPMYMSIFSPSFEIKLKTNIIFTNNFIIRANIIKIDYNSDILVTTSSVQISDIISFDDDIILTDDITNQFVKSHINDTVTVYSDVGYVEKLQRSFDSDLTIVDDELTIEGKTVITSNSSITVTITTESKTVGSSDSSVTLDNNISISESQ